MKNKSNFERLKSSFQGRILDRIPYLEYWVFNQKVLEFVLKKEIPPIDGLYGCPITPEDNIDFVQKIGQDAVVLDFIWETQ